MKNIILTIILIFSSVSFAIQRADFNETKKNVPVLVDYLAQNLKLNSKQKAVVMNAFSDYANSIIVSKSKFMKQMSVDYKKSTKADSPRNSKDDYKVAEKKHMTPYVLRFTEKRNAIINDVLRGKQKKQYNELQKLFNPISLELKKDKIKNIKK
tara:strand:+ start:900 stop:1361 length:462 start_codon:yes stop_codon:yes gene_type:complete